MAANDNSPKKFLEKVASEIGAPVQGHYFAQHMDQCDPLKDYRKKFAYPKKGTLGGSNKRLVNRDEDCIYLCGNSLGLKPLKADVYMQKQMDKWAKTAVEMHFSGHLPAALCDLHGKDKMGKLTGADPSCLTFMNGLSVNLNLLLLSFYQPTADRFKILIEEHAFPSDRYAVVAQAELRGYDPKEAILQIRAPKGEHTIRTEDILKLIEEKGHEISVVCLSGVQYYTGQKFEMGTITKAAQKKGCIVGWDLAHAIGNVEVKLDEWNVDFACWCTYKYLNSGPGCIGGAYINKRHEKRTHPHLVGWWSNATETRFEMREECDVAPGVEAFRISNPPPFLMALVTASLEIFEEVGMENLIKKQFLLTGYLELLIKANFTGSMNVTAEIITPESTEERGSQLSIIFSRDLGKVHKALQERGIVCDVRPPSVMRLAPIPLYNSFLDVYRFIQALKEVLEEC